MEGNLSHTDQIEAYILNQMDSGQKAAFEKLLKQDPLLQQEFDIQKDIIQTIQQNRKAELKSRLNKLNVNNSGISNTIKIAASILLISAIGSGAYLFNNSNEPDTVAIETTTSVKPTETKPIENIQSEIVKTPVEPIKPVSESHTQKAKQEEKLNQNTKHKPAETQQPAAPTVNIPQIADDFASSDNFEKNISLPNSDVAKTIDTKAKLDVNLVDDAGAISYQYFSNKLYLFGKFSAGKYEILELNNRNNKEMYLYFDGQYYYLKPNTESKTQLESIKNQDIKSQLEQIREK